jgi:hypothetical protein
MGQVRMAILSIPVVLESNIKAILQTLANSLRF